MFTLHLVRTDLGFNLSHLVQSYAIKVEGSKYIASSDLGKFFNFEMQDFSALAGSELVVTVDSSSSSSSISFELLKVLIFQSRRLGIDLHIFARAGNSPRGFSGVDNIVLCAANDILLYERNQKAKIVYSSEIE